MPARQRQIAQGVRPMGDITVSFFSEPQASSRTRRVSFPRVARQDQHDATCRAMEGTEFFACYLNPEGGVVALDSQAQSASDCSSPGSQSQTSTPGPVWPEVFSTRGFCGGALNPQVAGNNEAGQYAATVPRSPRTGHLRQSLGRVSVPASADCNDWRLLLSLKGVSPAAFHQSSW